MLYQSRSGTVLVGGSAEENPGTSCYPSCNTNIALVRLNDDSSLDTGFGTGGKVEIDLGASETSTAAIEQLDSLCKVVVVGSRTSTTSEYVIAQINESGGPNDTFGGDGVITGTTPSTLVDEAQTASNGNYDLVAAGTADNDIVMKQKRSVKFSLL